MRSNLLRSNFTPRTGPATLRILLVDDDWDIRQLLAEQLTAAGYEVATAADGVEMRRQLAKATTDLIVLDLNLRYEDGLSLCRELRVKADQTPIIMLTARTEPVDRVIGLEMGADDYLAKPFEPRELLARIRSVMRRATSLPINAQPLAARAVRFAGWTLDFERRHLADPEGRLTILSGAEFDLLRVLVSHPNVVLTREQLQGAAASGRSPALDRAIDLKVSRLRSKFGEQGASLICTVRGQGYVFAAPVIAE